MTLTLGQEAFRRLWLPPANSTQAADTDFLFMFIMWVCIFSFVLLMGAMFWFMYRYRRRPGVPTIRSVSHNTPLELAWSIGPLLILVPIFFWGFHGYIDKQAAPANAETIRITGEKWSWSPVYANGATPREFASGPTASEVPVIIVPAAQPVRLIFTSKDVIHAFFIPDFRTKIDVIPNRYTSMWFQPLHPTPFLKDATGNTVKDVKGNPIYADHRVYCAEYCGDNHSEMGAFIRVLPSDEFEKMKADWAGVDPTWTQIDKGRFYWKNKFGCRSCHSIDGSAGTGPTWLDLWGRTEDFRDGTTINLTDEVEFDNYVRQSVYEPNARIVKGYTPQMNSYQGQVTEDHLQALLAFMKSPEVAKEMNAARGTTAPPAGAAPPDAKPPETPAAPPPGSQK